MEFRELHTTFRRLRFPRLGKVVGGFPLYDSLCAGLFERIAGGERIAREELPVPDEDVIRFVSEIREKRDLSNEEREFLEYCDLIDKLKEHCGPAKQI